jgi:hypothetical protein
MDQSEDIGMLQEECRVREIYKYIYIERERDEREDQRKSAYLTAATSGTDP